MSSTSNLKLKHSTFNPNCLENLHKHISKPPTISQYKYKANSIHRKIRHTLRDMEQEGVGRNGNNRQALQLQRCPRCDSANTKFSHYNNRSLSQPRHFCKACKSYWTQGGAFRNIPIGGGSRNGKRTKRSSSSSMSQLQPLLQEMVQNYPNMTTSLRPSSLPMVVHSTNLCYQSHGGGGYLSSLARNPSQTLNQSLKNKVDVVASSNSPLLLNTTSLLGSQHHHLSQIGPSLSYQVGNRGNIDSLYSAAQGLIPSSVDQWPRSLIKNANHNASDSSVEHHQYCHSISGNSYQNNFRGGPSSLIPNHWPDPPRYGAPR